MMIRIIEFSTATSLANCDKQKAWLIIYDSKKLTKLCHCGKAFHDSCSSVHHNYYDLASWLASIYIR